MSPLPALCTDKSLEGEKKDYSFVSDVISVAVLFDLPCPVRAHQFLPLLSSTTSWPPGPFLLPPQPHPPILLRQTNMPSHSSCLNSFVPSLFQSLTQKAQTQMMNKKLTIRLNAIQVDPSAKEKRERRKVDERDLWFASVKRTPSGMFFCPCGRQLKVKSSLHERIHSTSFFLRQKENLC